MKETDLYEPVKEWLLDQVGCEKVYPEISDVDVLGLAGKTDIIVELKTRFSFKLLEQAEDRLRYAPYVYIAVPYPKKSGFSSPSPTRFIEQWSKSRGIGILYVDIDARTKVYCYRMARFSHSFSKYKKQGTAYDIRSHIEEWSDRNTGGAKGGETVTGYKVMIENIKCYLDRERIRDEQKERDAFGLIDVRSDDYIDGAFPVIDRVLNPGDRTIEMILKHCETRYSNPKPSLVATLKQKWNQDWCKISNYNGNVYYRTKK